MTKPVLRRVSPTARHKLVNLAGPGVSTKLRGWLAVKTTCSLSLQDCSNIRLLPPSGIALPFTQGITVCPSACQLSDKLNSLLQERCSPASARIDIARSEIYNTYMWSHTTVSSIDRRHLANVCLRERKFTTLVSAGITAVPCCRNSC
jgi:hypothetical protein